MAEVSGTLGGLSATVRICKVTKLLRILIGWTVTCRLLAGLLSPTTMEVTRRD
jgi:hypothetical protein